MVPSHDNRSWTIPPRSESAALLGLTVTMILAVDVAPKPLTRVVAASARPDQLIRECVIVRWPTDSSQQRYIHAHIVVVVLYKSMQMRSRPVGVCLLSSRASASRSFSRIPDQLCGAVLPFFDDPASTGLDGMHVTRAGQCGVSWVCHQDVVLVPESPRYRDSLAFFCCYFRRRRD